MLCLKHTTIVSMLCFLHSTKPKTQLQRDHQTASSAPWTRPPSRESHVKLPIPIQMYNYLSASQPGALYTNFPFNGLNALTTNLQVSLYRLCHLCLANLSFSLSKSSWHMHCFLSLFTVHCPLSRCCFVMQPTRMCLEKGTDPHRFNI